MELKNYQMKNSYISMRIPKENLVGSEDSK